MSLIIQLTAETIQQLDLTPVQTIIQSLVARGELLSPEHSLQFKIDYPQEATDPRELSEIPEIRLWFIRLDGAYPWLPYILDWKEGELARYTAMLVPHQFNRSEGIQYNAEALEIFVMSKIFIIGDWLKQQDKLSVSRLKSMAQMLGYDIEEEFFQLF